MEINKKLKFVLVNGEKLFVEHRDVIVNIDPPSSRAEEIRQVIETFIEQYNNKIVCMNGMLDFEFDTQEIKANSYTLRFLGNKLKKTKENFITSFDDDLKREFVNGLFEEFLRIGTDFSSLSTHIRINRSKFETKQGEVVVHFLTALKDQEFLPHTVNVSWDYNQYYSPTCPTCQDGVSHFMSGLHYVNNRVFVSQNNRPKKSEEKWILGDATLEVKDANSFSFVQIKKTETYEDILNWISEIFVGAIEMSHISNVKMRIGEEVFEVKGTDE